MPIFLLLLALSVYGAETSISRYARSEHGVLSKEYDMEGGRAYWINGISVMGLPDAGADVMGFSEPAKRLPLGFSGLYTPPPIYERYGLSLNASNGNLIFRENYNPIDTPVTNLLWERYGLEGNAFIMNFNRLLLDSIAFSLGLASHTVPKSDNFIYQDIVNQFYTGTLKRDSLMAPMTGRNLAYNSFHFVPAVSWIFPNSSITAQMSFLWLDNDDVTRDTLVKDSITYLIDFPKRPYNIKGGANFYRLLWNYRFLPNWELSLSHRFANQELNYSRLDSGIYFPWDVSETYNAQTGEGRISHKSFLNPYINVRYEYLRSKDYLPAIPLQEHGANPLYQDRQLVLLGINDTLWRFAFRGQSGLQRNASAFDSVDFTPSLHAGMTMFLPWHLQFNFNYQKDTRFPDIHETHILRVGRIAFPNEELKAEKRRRMGMDLAYKLNEYFFYEIGYRHEESENAIMPFWAIPKERYLDSLPADSAFKWANAGTINNSEFFWRLGFGLGNWRFFAEKGKTLSRAKIIDIPLVYYKGAVYWSDRFVEERLKVTVQFDADWFGGKWNYALENDSIASPFYLRNYISLNFKSSMQIQNFILYARIENMNHSLIEPETGYTPPGIRFAYGIEWELRD